MAKWREIAKLLDSCHSLFLQEIGEPQENVLRLLLVEAERSDEAESMQVGGTIIEDLHRVQATDRTRAFELIWTQYVVYAVTNESFGSPNGEETEDSGRLLRCYSQSPFLDYVAHDGGDKGVSRPIHPRTCSLGEPHRRRSFDGDSKLTSSLAVVNWRNIAISLTP
jgi:hypothetical protein